MLRTFGTIGIATIFAFFMITCSEPPGSEIGGGDSNDGNKTPIALDFNITGLLHSYDGNQKEVVITPKAGRSDGEITVWYEGIGETEYEKGQTPPSELGVYSVTFDVAVTSAFDAVNGLVAGSLRIVIPIDPTATDFNISGLNQVYNGTPRHVSIIPKSDKSTGEIKIWYQGTGSTVYIKSTTPPSANGTYSIIFDVAKAPGFNGITNLPAGVLTIAASGDGSTADFPIVMVVTRNLGNMPEVNSGWRQLLAEINTAGKFVALDLSACTMVGADFNPASSVTTGKDRIVSIILPNVATSITDGNSSGNFAFRNFTNLTTVSGANIIDIGNYAFYQLSNLVTINFLAVKNLGERAFFNCTALVEVNFPAAESIGRYAFRGCSALTTINFPKVTIIGGSAFLNCASLTSVSFPELITISDSPVSSIEGVFHGTGITEVHFPKLINLGNYAFQGSSITAVNLPEVTSIGNGAFWNCAYLSLVNIPKARSIGNSAFGDCVSLEEVSFPIATFIDIGAFSRCNTLISVYLPEATSIGNAAFRSTKLVEIDLPKVATVSGYAFEGSTLLTKVNLPSIISFDGPEVFMDTGVHDITLVLGQNAPSLGVIMFSDVTRTVHVHIPFGAEGYTPFTDTDIKIVDHEIFSRWWANGLRGEGWPYTIGQSRYRRINITVVFEYY